MDAGRTALAQRAALLSLCSTVVVVTVKLAAAWLSGSVSVLAEGLQSTVDVAMSLVAVLTLGYAALPPDADHPYGHGKAELISSAFQMLAILGSGVFILWKAYERLGAPQEIRWDWGAGAMAYAALANLAVAAYASRVAVRTDSAVLLSESLHLRGDALTSAGVLLGMLAVGLTGWMVLDPIVAAGFTGIAMVVAVVQLRRVLHPLMDGSLPVGELRLLESILSGHPESRGYHNLRTRRVGTARYVDLHLLLDDDLTFVRAHEVAELIEDELRKALGGAIVNTHFEPHDAELKHRAERHGERPSDAP